MLALTDPALSAFIYGIILYPEFILGYPDKAPLTRL